MMITMMMIIIMMVIIYEIHYDDNDNGDHDVNDDDVDNNNNDNELTSNNCSSNTSRDSRVQDEAALQPRRPLPRYPLWSQGGQRGSCCWNLAVCTPQSRLCFPVPVQLRYRTSETERKSRNSLKPLNVVEWNQRSHFAKLENKNFLIGGAGRLES